MICFFHNQFIFKLKAPYLWNDEYGNQKSNDVQRQTDPHEVRKLVVTDTLYDEVGLVADRS